MWSGRSLTALVLLFVVAPSYSQDSDEGGFLGKSLGVLRSVGILASDKTDSVFIESIYRPVMERLRTPWSCVVGLSHEVGPSENMKMWNGALLDVNLTPLEKSSKLLLEVNDVKNDPKVQGLVTASVNIKFPEMILKSEFQYNSTYFGVFYSRTGKVQIKVSPATVKINIRLPNSKKVIQEYPDKKQCQNKVKHDEIKTEAGDYFEVVDIDYPSLTKVSYSKSAMTTVFQGLKKDIRTNVFATLERHVANVVKTIAFSCLDDSASSKWKPLNKGVDCSTTRLATRYGQK